MDTEKQYIKGFNNGYLLAQHLPDLLSKVLQDVSPSNEYVEGLVEGKDQFELEMENSRTHLNDLGRLRNQSKDKTSDLDRDI